MLQNRQRSLLKKRGYIVIENRVMDGRNRHRNPCQPSRKPGVDIGPDVMAVKYIDFQLPAEFAEASDRRTIETVPEIDGMYLLTHLPQTIG